jgi:nucleoid-associated protein YgaU
MSCVRWTTTCLVMAGTAWLLAALGPGTEQVRAAVTAPQALVDTAGPDALLVVAATAAGWLCWGWGALGLLLTGLSALPGAGGRAAGLLLLVVLPAGARRVAAVAVGLSLAAGAPAWVNTSAVPTAAVTTSPAPAGAGSLVAASLETDWPLADPLEHAAGPAPEQEPAAPPDWPGGPPGEPGPADPSAEHVVLRGDCLWDIAADALARQRAGAPVSDAEIATEVHAWWQANATVIGPDPDLLLPGQVLRSPR